jgi:hypothetical protein
MREVIVHLVHGTWPYGPFKRKPTKEEKVWFDPDSEFCRSISSELGARVEFVPHLWSGSNTFRARSLAAADLALELAAAVNSSHPDSAHVVVAHSHGGTVSASAVGFLSDSVARRIESLICISTPFAYWVLADIAHRAAMLWAQASLLAASVVVFLCLTFAPFVVAHGMLVFVACSLLGLIWFIGVLLLRAVLRAGGRIPRYYPQSYEIPKSTNMLILRSPQDEASIAIGLAQTMHWIARKMYGLVGEVPGQQSYVKIIAGAAAFPLFLLAGAQIARWLVGVDGLWVFEVGSLLGLGALALIYFFCAFLASLSVGYFRVGHWAVTAVEVEMTPPGIPCTVKIAPVDPLDESDSIRHGAYNRPWVRDEIRSELSAVSARPPMPAPSQQTFGLERVEEDHYRIVLNGPPTPELERHNSSSSEVTGLVSIFPHN